MRVVDHVRTNAHLKDEQTALELSNRKLAGRAAEEGMVLLKNDGTLPLKAEAKIALFGRGAVFTVKGGSGSGEVNGRKAVSVYGGLRKEGYEITTEQLLARYVREVRKDHREDSLARQKKAGLLHFNVTMAALGKPYLPPEFPLLTKEDLTDPEDVCVYVISRMSGEGYDRKNEPGDFQLSEREQANLLLCSAHYQKTVLVLNVGGAMDLSPLDSMKIGAVLLMSMAGCEGGTAAAKILSGQVTPSGRLTATWPRHYEDIPFASEYAYLNGNEENEYYNEGIYVGYRYFDTYGKEPRYPFGYGLSYTTFQEDYSVSFSKNELRVDAEVVNTGTVPGRQVVEVYASAPKGDLDKEYQRLVGYAKTGLLDAGGKETVRILVSLKDLASFDPVTARWILEPGTYRIRAGRHSRDTRMIAGLDLSEELVLSQHDHICLQLEHLNELTGSDSEAKAEGLPTGLPVFRIDPAFVQTRTYRYGQPEAPLSPVVEKWLGELSTNQLVDIVVGAGNDLVLGREHFFTVPGAAGYTTAKFAASGIPDMSFCDGPAGIRVDQKAVALKGRNRVRAITAPIQMMNDLPAVGRRIFFGKPEDGTVLYQYPTAWPVGTALAQTWNRDLLEAVGRGIHAELEEYGVTFWLGPGINIMRNPLCGRNYEYYSEDPLLTGQTAAALIRGVQAGGCHFACAKHFLCNSQETNRQKNNANVSERAIREIYLPAFETAVREGKVGAVMTSYNLVNGVYSDMNRDTLTKVLRCEWGFEGLVMTDWDGVGRAGDAVFCLEAGMDILMSGNPLQKQAIRRALRKKTLDPKVLRQRASYVLAAAAKRKAEFTGSR